MKKGHKIALFATAGALATGWVLYNNWRLATPTDKVNNFVYRTTGYNNATNKFDNKNWLVTIMPVGLGVVGSALASKSKVNRYISAIPWVKL